MAKFSGEEDELPDILVKPNGAFHLTELQREHIKFLYTRTTLPKLDIAWMVNIDMSTLDRLITRSGWPLRQPNHWTQRHRVNHKANP